MATGGQARQAVCITPFNQLPGALNGDFRGRHSVRQMLHRTRAVGQLITQGLIHAEGGDVCSDLEEAALVSQKVWAAVHWVHPVATELPATALHWGEGAGEMRDEERGTLSHSTAHLACALYPDPLSQSQLSTVPEKHFFPSFTSLHPDMHASQSDSYTYSYNIIARKKLWNV